MRILIDRVMDAILREEFDIRITRRRDVDGLCNYKRKTVYVSVHAPAPVSVLIHETLHWLYPQWSEGTVLYWENKLYQELATEDRRILNRVLREAKARGR